MLGVTRTVVRNAINPRFYVPIRNEHYISGPPRNRVPFWEKMAFGSVIMASILSIPAWVLAHMEDYKNKEAKS